MPAPPPPSSLSPFPSSPPNPACPPLNTPPCRHPIQPKAVEAHVSALREWTYGQLAALRHANGAPLLRIFGAHERGSEAQSCVFQFVVQHANGSARAAPRVQADATAAGLHVRVGCDCNPGMCLLRLGITPEEVRAAAVWGQLSERGG